MKTAEVLNSEGGGDGGGDERCLGYDNKKDRLDAAMRRRTFLGSSTYSQTSLPLPSSLSDADNISFSGDMNFTPKPCMVLPKNLSVDEQKASLRGQKEAYSQFQKKTSDPEDCAPGPVPGLVSRPLSSGVFTSVSSNEEVTPETITPASSSETHPSSNTHAELATSQESRSEEEFIADDLLELNSVDGGEDDEQVAQTDKSVLRLRRVRPEDANPQSYPSNRTSSRLSWDPMILESEKYCTESDSESVTSGEGNPLIQKLKDGVADALVNSVVALATYKAVVLSVVDANNHLYGRKKCSK